MSVATTEEKKKKETQIGKANKWKEKLVIIEGQISGELMKDALVIAVTHDEKVTYSGFSVTGKPTFKCSTKEDAHKIAKMINENVAEANAKAWEPCAGENKSSSTAQPSTRRMVIKKLPKFMTEENVKAALIRSALMKEEDVIQIFSWKKDGERVGVMEVVHKSERWQEFVGSGKELSVKLQYGDVLAPTILRMEPKIEMPRCGDCFSLEHQRNECTNGRLCGKCGALDHVARQCKKGAYCYHCDSTTHQTRNCRTRVATGRKAVEMKQREESKSAARQQRGTTPVWVKEKQQQEQDQKSSRPSGCTDNCVHCQTRTKDMEQRIAGMEQEIALEKKRTAAIEQELDKMKQIQMEIANLKKMLQEAEKTQLKHQKEMKARDDTQEWIRGSIAEIVKDLKEVGMKMSRMEPPIRVDGLNSTQPASSAAVGNHSDKELDRGERRKSPSKSRSGRNR